jgi:hypothetical protein
MTTATQAQHPAQSELKIIDADTHPQTIDVVATRARAQNFDVVVGDPTELLSDDVFGVLLSQPRSTGEIVDLVVRGECEEVLAALADPHRRRLLVALLDHNPQKDTLQVPEAMDTGDVALETLQMRMYHQHLPKLEAAGYIRWDQDKHEVVKGPKFDEIRPLLELIHANRDELPEGGCNWDYRMRAMNR